MMMHGSTMFLLLVTMAAATGEGTAQAADHAAFQMLQAAMAMVCGFCMLVQGDVFFKVFIVGTIFGSSYFTAVPSLEVEKNLELIGTRDHRIVHGLALAFGALMATAAWRGFNGIKVIIGGVVGFYVAYELDAILRNSKITGNYANQYTEHYTYNASLLFGFVVLLGVVSFLGSTYKRVTAILCSVIGGLLVASALGYIVMFVAGRNGATPGGVPLPLQPPAWSKFLESVSQLQAEPVGIFANAGDDYNPTVRGFHLHADQVLGRLAWVFLAYTGYKFQFWRQRLAERSKY